MSNIYPKIRNLVADNLEEFNGIMVERTISLKGTGASKVPVWNVVGSIELADIWLEVKTVYNSDVLTKFGFVFNDGTNTVDITESTTGLDASGVVAGDQIIKNAGIATAAVLLSRSQVRSADDANKAVFLTAKAGATSQIMCSFTGEGTYGYQEWGFSVAKTGASATGLADDTTEYTFTVSVDGGDAQTITVVGSTAQTVTTLAGVIDAALSGAGCAFVDVGDTIKITSDLAGDGSTIEITDVDLFSSLTDINPAAEIPVDGESDTDVEVIVHAAYIKRSADAAVTES